jgi:hypothetical protein
MYILKYKDLIDFSILHQNIYSNKIYLVDGYLELFARFW